MKLWQEFTLIVVGSILAVALFVAFDTFSFSGFFFGIKI